MKHFLSNFSPTGPGINRSQYTLSLLLSIVALISLSIVTLMWESSLSFVYLLFFFLVISLGIRRNHDMGISGWWVLISIVIPLYPLVICFIPGAKGPTKYSLAPFEKGRLSRRKYLVLLLFCGLFGGLLFSLSIVAGLGSLAGIAYASLGGIVGIIALLIVLTTKRLHDVNLGGTWTLGFFLWISCSLYLGEGISSFLDYLQLDFYIALDRWTIYLAAQVLTSIFPFLVLASFPGTQGPNKYGPDPLQKLSTKN